MKTNTITCSPTQQQMEYLNEFKTVSTGVHPNLYVNKCLKLTKKNRDARTHAIEWQKKHLNMWLTKNHKKTDI